MSSKRPEVIVRKGNLISRAGRIIEWIGKDGGFYMSCGCIIGAKADELRMIMRQSGPEAIVEIVDSIEIDHNDCCKVPNAYV